MPRAQYAYLMLRVGPLDMPPDLAERQLDVYNEAQANLEKQVKEGLLPHAELERLLYDKLSVEIDLFNIKNAHDGHQ